MAYFPTSIIPKRLKKETTNEVDDSPLVYDARDYNRHLREIRSIECSLLGSTSGTGTLDILTRAETLTTEMKRGGLLVFLSGTVFMGSQIQVPDRVSQVTIQGPLAAAATTITVDDASYMPKSGYLTKMNALTASQYCTSGAPVGPGDACAAGVKYMAYDDFLGGSKTITSQELISYNGVDLANNQLLNCTRGVDGTTAQALTGNAVGIAGWACISLTPNGFVRKWIKPNQLYVAHDAMLNVTAEVLEQGSAVRVKDPISEYMEVGYAWAILGNFAPLGLGTGFSCQV